MVERMPITKSLALLKMGERKIQSDNPKIANNSIGIASDEGSNISGEGRGLAGRLYTGCPTNN